MSKQVAQQILAHCDKDEILTKLLSEISIDDIHDWLKAKYQNEKVLIVSKKNLQIFKDDYLDVYSTLREDLLKTQFNLASTENDIMQEIQGTEDYKRKLSEIADKELDIKTIIKQMVVKIELRADQVFTAIQNDPRNIKMDRTLIELMQLLLNMLEKFDLITNGNPEQINIQNNINIQLVDDHINMVYSVIREILTQLDYETSLLFTELFTQKLSELKQNSALMLSQDNQLGKLKEAEVEMKQKLNI